MPIGNSCLPWSLDIPCWILDIRFFCLLCHPASAIIIFLHSMFDVGRSMLDVHGVHWVHWVEGKKKFKIQYSKFKIQSQRCEGKAENQKIPGLWLFIGPRTLGECPNTSKIRTSNRLLFLSFIYHQASGIQYQFC